MVYVLFGSSNHLSMGTHGVISLMVGSVVASYDGTLYPYIDDIASANISSASNNTHQYLSMDRNEAKITIAMSLAFLVGIIQVS